MNDTTIRLRSGRHLDLLDPKPECFTLAEQVAAQVVRQRLDAIYSQREEILAAFVAKYGFEPERAVQVEQRMDDGTTRWFVHRRSDDDMAALASMSAQL